MGTTYEVPSFRTGVLAKALLSDWAIENVVQAHSALPVEVVDVNVGFNGYYGDVRPDVVPGQPLYLHGPKYPGSMAFNSAALKDPPSDPKTFAALRQGTLPRNALRGFGAAQWDLAIHRTFPIHEQLKLQFRAELFNVLNHPNFGPPSGSVTSGQFGLSSQTLGQFLGGGNSGSGGFSPLYQIGGPRSMQFALKLSF